MKIDHTTIRPGGPPKDTPTAAERRWWTMPADKAPASITACLAQLEEQERARASQLVRSMRLYGNAPLQGFYGLGPQQATVNAGPYKDRISYNISQAVTDTVTSKLGKNKPRPLFLTSGGDFGEQRKAKNLNKFIAGLFYENKQHVLGPMWFRDGCVLGDGVLHVYAKHGRVRYERVLNAELKIDELEGAYGCPRQMHRVKLIDRYELAEAFKSKRKVILDAPNAWMRDVSTSRPHIADMLLVRESWHLPSGPDAKDGKHIVSIGEGPLTAMMDWKHDFFPFIKMPWSPKPVGFWGQGLVEQIQPLQLEINKILYLVQRSYHLGGSFKILMEMGSKIAPEHLNNQVGAVVKYQGQKPEYVVPPLLPPEMYEHIERLERMAYEQGGVNRLSVGGTKPAGLNSGIALREYEDIETDRFQTVGKQYEEAHLELAAVSLAVLQDMLEEEGGKSYEVKVPQKRWLEQVDWKDIDLDAEAFVMQCFPVSSLPNEPAGRLQTVTEMIQSGLVDQRSGKRLLNFPDIEQEESLSGAAEDYLTKILDEMLEDDDEENYTAPEPYDNPELAFELAQQYYLAGKRDNLDEAKLEKLRRFMAQAQELMQAAMPPAPMPGAPGTPPADPQPTPQSELIPNVNTPGATA